MAKTINGTVKRSQKNELVAEVSQNDAATIKAGRTVVTVAGVTARVKRIGDRFRTANGFCNYLYLDEPTAEGTLPELRQPQPVKDTGEQPDELRHGISTLD